MPKKLLYEYALAMLRATNPYAPREIEEIGYHWTDEYGFQDFYSLVSILNRECGNAKQSIDARYGEKMNRIRSMEAISGSMEQYLSHYQAAFAVKQQVRKNFRRWLTKLEETYGISEDQYVNGLSKTVRDADTAIALVKELQDPTGVASTALSEKLGMSLIGIKKDLRKLDPSLWEDPSEDRHQKIPPFRLGGQPMHVKIRTFRKEHDSRNYYVTDNTLHPLVLQQNLMQVATTMKALAHLYETGNEVSQTIGADIWYQLTDYAHHRIRRYFAGDDEILEKFLDHLDHAFPDDRLCGYQTERQMLQSLGILSLDEYLNYARKSPDRRCDLWLKEGDTILELPEQRIMMCHPKEEKRYVAIDRDGNRHYFNREDIFDIYATR